MALDIDTVYRDNVIKGDIHSGANDPDKAEIRALLKTLSGAAGNPSIVKQTKAALDLVTPASENYGGLVLNDPDATKNGYYYRDSAAWVKGRGFPDTFAVLTSIGGTANAITASTEAGVNPADVLCVLLPDPPGTNSSSTVTLTLNGGAAESIKAASGANLAVGDIIEGVGTLFFKVGSEWRQLFSSATGATFDHQGDWDSGTTYTEAQIVTGSNGNWYQLKVPSSLNDDPVSGGTGDWLMILDSAALADGSVTEPKLATALTATLPVIADSITAMKALTTNRPVLVRSYYGDGRGGGGLFVPDAGDAVSADNGGTVIVRSDGMRMKRDNANLRDIDVLEWGVSSELADNSTRYDAIIAAAEGGAVIRWTKSDGAYLGHFNAVGKAFKLRGNGAVVTDTEDATPIISMIGSAAALTTATNTAAYGASSIALTSVAGLAAGDIFYIYDAKNHGGINNNLELHKVRSIASLTVTVVDMFRSDQDSGTINVYKLTPISAPEISGFEVIATDTHVTNVLSIWYAENAEISGNVVRNSTGRAVDLRYCYAPKAIGNKVLDAFDVGSGNGYGVAISHSRNITVHDTYGRGLRHAVDVEGTYCGEIINSTHEGVPGVESLTVVTPIHDSFGGNLVVEGVYGWGVYAPAVQISGQGVANPIAQIIRDLTVRNVRLRSTAAVTDTVIGVYMQTSYAGLTIEDVQVEVVPGSETLNSASSCCVRIGGQCHGFSLIQGLKSRRLMCGVFASVDGTIPGGMPSIGLLVIKDAFVGACNSVVWARGVKHIETYTLAANSSVGGVRVVTTPHNGVTTTTNTTGGNEAVVT